MKTLPYWIEDLGNGNYDLWTKVSVPANETITFYIIKTVDDYKPEGNSVFLFFDDFRETSLDMNNWNEQIDKKGESASIDKSFSNNIYSVIARKSGSEEGYCVYTLSTKEQLTGFMKVRMNFRWYSINGYSKIYTNKKIIESHSGGADWSDCQTGFKIVTARLENENVIIKAGNTETYYGTYGGFDIDYIFIRKIADKEPIINVEQTSDITWKITVYNPNDYDLIDFQIKINGNDIVNDKNCSLLITSEPLIGITIEFSSLYIRNGYVVIKDLYKQKILTIYEMTFARTVSDIHICTVGDYYIYTKDGKLFINDTEVTYKDINKIMIYVTDKQVKININNEYTSVIPSNKIKIGDNVDVKIKLTSIINK